PEIRAYRAKDSRTSQKLLRGFDLRKTARMVVSVFGLASRKTKPGRPEHPTPAGASRHNSDQSPSLAAPAGVRTERKDARSIRVIWNSSSPVEQYRVELARNSGNFVEIGKIEGSQSGYDIGDLASDDFYRVRLRACACGDDCSPYSKIATIAATGASR